MWKIFLPKNKTSPTYVKRTRYHIQILILNFPTKPFVALHLMECHDFEPVKAAIVIQDKSAKVVVEVNTNSFPCEHCD